jgi:hypothetical protein
MASFVRYIDVVGIVFFAITFLSSLHISSKLVNKDYLKNINDPIKIKNYKIIASPRSKVISLIILLSCIYQFFEPTKNHSGGGKAVIIVLITFSILLFIQAIYMFKQKEF